MIEWLNNKWQILRGSGPSTGRNQLALASFQVSAFIKLLLAYMHARTHTHTHTHTHTLTCSIPCLRKWTVSAAFRSFCREDWLDSWNEQRELLPRPSATDHSSLVASSIPLPDWDQWPVTRIQCCLQLPDCVISGLFLWRAPSGLLPDLEFQSPSSHRCSQVRTRSPALSLGFPWVACSPAPPSQENTWNRIHGKSYVIKLAPLILWDHTQSHVLGFSLQF